jgi:hypothetical protein
VFSHFIDTLAALRFHIDHTGQEMTTSVDLDALSTVELKALMIALLGEVVELKRMMIAQCLVIRRLRPAFGGKGNHDQNRSSPCSSP